MTNTIDTEIFAYVLSIQVSCGESNKSSSNTWIHAYSYIFLAHINRMQEALIKQSMILLSWVSWLSEKAVHMLSPKLKENDKHCQNWEKAQAWCLLRSRAGWLRPEGAD